MRYLLALLITPLICSSAFAQNSWDENKWIRQTLRAQCEWYENCTHKYIYRYVRRPQVESWRYYHRPEVDSLSRLDRCKPAVRVWSAQAQSEDNAYRKAIEAWAGSVRFQFGEIYIGIEHAENVKKLCGPSAVADTITSKLQDRIGIEYWRCELTATPCRPKPKRED